MDGTGRVKINRNIGTKWVNFGSELGIILLEEEQVKEGE